MSHNLKKILEKKAIIQENTLEESCNFRKDNQNDKYQLFLVAFFEVDPLFPEDVDGFMNCFGTGFFIGLEC